MWEVIVGNVGTVFSGRGGFNARKTFDNYVSISKSGIGRAGDETVSLWYDGELMEEYDPKHPDNHLEHNS